MISITRIKVSELVTLVSNPDYPSWEVIPISKHRAISYFNNPRCNPSDVVLYLASIEGKLVGYRTVMPDTLYKDGKSIIVGWLSGNWVNPKLRRRGIASELFRAASEDWGGRFLYTNYALESKAVYDKTKRFVKVKTLMGTRSYIRPCLAKVLPAKGKIFRSTKVVWSFLDFLLSFVNPLPLISNSFRIKDAFIECVKVPDKEIISFYSKLTDKSPSRREAKELDWIFHYPWLVSSPGGDTIGEKYFFSSSPKSFEQYFLKVYRNNKPVGFLMINNTDGFISTPYIYCNERDSNLFAKILLRHSVSVGASRLTTYHETIAKELKGLWPFGWLSLWQQRNFFAANEVVNELDECNLPFLEGDGDCAFV